MQTYRVSEEGRCSSYHNITSLELKVQIHDSYNCTCISHNWFVSSFGVGSYHWWIKTTGVCRICDCVFVSTYVWVCSLLISHTDQYWSKGTAQEKFCVQKPCMILYKPWAVSHWQSHEQYKYKSIQNAFISVHGALMSLSGRIHYHL